VPGKGNYASEAAVPSEKENVLDVLFDDDSVPLLYLLLLLSLFL
jgi:hypothetical protein